MFLKSGWFKNSTKLIWVYTSFYWYFVLLGKHHLVVVFKIFKLCFCASMLILKLIQMNDKYDTQLYKYVKKKNIDKETV